MSSFDLTQYKVVAAQDIEAAAKSGAKEILYILGSTPDWAAKYVRPDKYYYGGGTASEPAKLAYWRDWVRAVATRYKGRITSYQIWNEANLASFWAPERPKHWVRMARLTEIAAEEIRAVDRRAKVVSASSTVIQGSEEYCWNTIPARIPDSWTGFSRSSTCPEVGFCKPAI